MLLEINGEITPEKMKRWSQSKNNTQLSWVAPHGMAHSFIELEKTVVHVIRLVSFL